MMKDKILPEKSKELLKYWITERFNIYLKRKNKEAFPWSSDRIFNEYRFCNVIRQMDKETNWLIDKWLNPLKDDKNLWFAPFLFRIFNLGCTFENFNKETSGIELITNFKENEEKFINFLNNQKLEGNKIFSTAYMITTHSKSIKNSKGEFLIENDIKMVLDNQKEIIEILEENSNSFEKVFKKIKSLRIDGFGSFILYQVILDLTYTRYLKNCKDINSYCHYGDGSIGGLNLMFERDQSFKKLTEVDVINEYKIILKFLNEEFNYSFLKEEFSKYNKEFFDIHDVEFLCCEVRKYIEASNGKKKKRFSIK